MKLSLNWMKDYVQIPDDMDLKKLAYDLTMSTVEVEDVIDLGKKFDNMCVGLIMEVLPHPKADKLRICKVSLGGEEMRDIVCGGINLEPGQKVVVARPGAIVRWHGEGDPVVIGLAKLRGVESYGMICASTEVGLEDLFPLKDEAEIMDITAFEAPAGTPLADALDLNDIILEIDNKSMTNRPDLWGHYGMAREISALYDLPLVSFEKYEAPAGVRDLEVDIQDLERCPRYNAVELSGLTVDAAPYYMQNRLWKVGQRPINNLVDVTNYVMMATGQPTHAFDSDHIKGHIVVRRAAVDEKLLLLNGKELDLSTDDLVIADTESAVGLAGVMGGAKDSVLPETNKVILEVANFQAQGIRRTALRYKNRTEAATRYEKAIDPERADLALTMSMKLFAEVCPNVTVTGYSDVYPNKLECAEIDVSLNWLESRLGKRVPEAVIESKFTRMGYQVSFDGDNMHVVVPTWRSTGDVSIKADIMEEVARMYGYENFEATPIVSAFDGAINQVEVELERRIKEYMAFRCGMQEVFTYPWMNDECVHAVLQDTTGIFKLSTPPSPTESYIKSSLLPNLCKAVAYNERYFHEFAIFEAAQIFRDSDYTTPFNPIEKLPYQRKHVGGAFVGAADSVQALFRKAKGVLEMMPRYTHMEAFTFKKETKPVWADNVVWLNIFQGDVKVGDLALLSKKAAMGCGIKNTAAMLFELDQESLQPFKSRTNKFVHMPEYPMNDYDISLLFDANVTWEQIKAVAIGKGNNELLHGVSFVDEYKGKQIPEGKKSVTIRLVIGSLQKTLKANEIESCAEAIAKRLKKQLGAEARF